MSWDGRYKPKPWGSGKTNMKDRQVTQLEYEWVITVNVAVPENSISEKEPGN
jgi:hypothetical protein